ncbi:MAG: methyltransferase domain-containing protein [bacterium]
MDRFTKLFPEDLTYEKKSRIKKAKKIAVVLKDTLGKTSDKKCLDFGCSLGHITGYLGGCFKKVFGVDVDASAIKRAKKINRFSNVSFYISQENKVPFADSFFDAIVFNQIYEHVQNPSKVVAEIKRVLKPGGVCYFGARNKYGIFDGHYNLPFLSWLPRSFADFYIKQTSNKKKYDIRLYSLSQLKELVKGFDIQDYTLSIINDPKKFNTEDVIPTNWGVNRIIFLLSKICYAFIPNYIWVLKKASI